MNYEKEIFDLQQRVTILEKILKENNIGIEHEQIPQKRDRTKYVFNGRIYAKNRLVLAVIKSFVMATNPTYNELKNAFDKTLQGSLNVVEEFDTAKQISDASKRYFMQDGDVIKLKDNSVVVVCSQWGIFNINKFITVVKQFGFEIQSV